jgi:hypothetical protein
LTVSPAPFDPVVRRPVHRLSTIVSTTVETADPLRAQGRPPSEFLRLGRLERFYLASVQQLPRVLAVVDLEPDSLTFQRGRSSPATVRRARLWLFDVQAGPIVAVLSVDVECGPKDLIPFMEDCYYDQVTVRGAPLAGCAVDALREAGIQLKHDAGVEFDAQRHQIVFTAQTLPDDVTQRLIYRADLDWRPEYSSIQFPGELNRRPTSAAAVGAYVSVLTAQQDYVENCALLSAVQIVAATGKVRAIRLAAYEALLAVRDLAQDRATLSTSERRAALARLNEAMAEQELQLTFGVETACEIGILIPALRVDAYHRQLVDCTGLRDNIATVSAMLTRLGSVLTAQTASQTSLDTRRQDLRRLRYGVAVGLLSAVAIPIGIILGFFGGQYKEVNSQDSMFDWRHYYGMYLSVVGLLVCAGLVFVGLFWRERNELHRMTGTNGH